MTCFKKSMVKRFPFFKKVLLGFFALIAILCNAQAQHTRAYFQQTVNYSIQVELDDTNNILRGYEEIEYINNSHHGIDTVWFHLWPNAYKNNQTALGKQLLENGATKFQFLDEKHRGYIDSLDFKINGKKINWIYHPKHIDICALILPKKLAPKERIEISTPFKVKIPLSGISRLGGADQSYQITQWYPKPAVFDREGWHPMPYLNQGEFYSEFGTFNVYISVPKDYVIAATGELKTKSEIDFLNTLAKKEYKEDTTTSLNAITSNNAYKILHFQQNNIHDFAWFGQKDFIVRQDSVQLQNSKKWVKTWAFFAPKNYREWKNVPRYINQAVEHYSKYNGDYPYSSCTAVEASLKAGGGMEYPMITIIDFGMKGKNLETVVVHEVGHNWFYGILGFNEREMPCLDEGINSFYEMIYFEDLYGIDTISTQVSSVTPFFQDWLNLKQVSVRNEKLLFYLFTARNNTDQKLTERAENFSMTNYGAVVYGKMAVSLQMLRDDLGDVVFNNAMQSFYSKWKFKHPSLNDFKTELELNSKKDLSWFFDHYLNSTEKLNVKIKNVNKKDDKFIVTVKNKSNIILPVTIATEDKSGLIINEHKINSLVGKTKIELPYAPKAKLVKIDANLSLVESNRKNNTSRTRGIFRKIEPIELKLISSLENPKKTQLFYMPLVGWNSSDQTMLGILLHNKSLLEKPFEFAIAPLYSFHRKTLNGIYSAEYHLFFKQFIKRLTIESNFQKFSFDNFTINNHSTSYERFYPKLKFDFKNKNARSPWRHHLRLGSILINEQTKRTNMPLISSTNQFTIVDWESTRKTRLSKSFIDIKSTSHQDFQLFELEGIQKIKYNKGKKEVSLRLYAGGFTRNETQSPRYNLRMSGQSGWNDYTFSSIFAERGSTHDLWQQQMNDNQGGFKTPTNNGQSNKWLMAVNLKTTLSSKIPIGIFSDLGTNSTNQFLYDAGVYLPIFKDILEIYFPLIWGNSIEQSYIVNGISYNQQIRFTLHLNKLNPFKLIDEIIE